MKSLFGLFAVILIFIVDFPLSAQVALQKAMKPSPDGSFLPLASGGTIDALKDNWTRRSVSPIGGHVWDNASIYVANPGGGLLTVLVPSLLYQSGYDWADLAPVCDLLGPASPMMSMFLSRATQTASQPVNCLAYVPEHPETAGQVPPEEAENLEQYLEQMVEVCAQYGRLPVYGPGSRLYGDPDTWVYGGHWDWQGDRMANLAAMLPAGSVLLIRPFTCEAKYRKLGQELLYAAAVEEIADLFLAGNADLKIIVHMSLVPGEEGVRNFLRRRQALIRTMRSKLCSTYAAVRMESQGPGSLAALETVMSLTGEPVLNP